MVVFWKILRAYQIHGPIPLRPYKTKTTQRSSRINWKSSWKTSAGMKRGTYLFSDLPLRLKLIKRLLYYRPLWLQKSRWAMAADRFLRWDWNINFHIIKCLGISSEEKKYQVKRAAVTFPMKVWCDEEIVTHKQKVLVVRSFSEIPRKSNRQKLTNYTKMQ